MMMTMLQTNGTQQVEGQAGIDSWQAKDAGRQEGMRTFTTLVDQVRDQAARRTDYMAPDSKISAVEDGTITLDLSPGVFPGGPEVQFSLSAVAFRQICDKLSIPVKYARRMAEEQPTLWAQNVNAWMAASGKTRLVRTLDGEVRGFLSDSYRPLDNLDFLAAIASAAQAKRAFVKQCTISDTRLYVKATTPDLFDEITPDMLDIERGHGGGTHWLKEPMPVRGFVIFSNSEVGCGGLQIDGGIEVLRCTNDYRSTEPIFRRIHAGGEKAGDDIVRQFIRSETQALKDRALWSEVHDVALGVFDRAHMQRFIDRFMAAMGQPVTLAADRAVESVADHYALGEAQRDSILNSFIAEGNLTQFGMAQAVTRIAQEVEDADGRFELEKLGTQIIELEPTAWQAIA